jgi:hypothetical protein
MSLSKSRYEAERWWLPAQEDLEIERATFFLEETDKLMRNE